jgi:ketosteroid isomerase-like protein
MSMMLEDKEAIRELLSSYCFCIDRGDPPGLLAQLAEDCVWDGGPIGRYEGAALRQFLSAAASSGERQRRHFLANEIITVTGDTATARSYLLVVNVADAGPSLGFAGFYEDRLVKRGGRWLFRERLIKFK